MKSPTPTRSGWCHLDAEAWSHDRCMLPDCPCDCHEVQTSTDVPEWSPTGISVLYTRHGDETFESGWTCLEDAQRFARWLTECGAAIDVEVVEL